MPDARLAVGSNAITVTDITPTSLVLNLKVEVNNAIVVLQLEPETNTMISYRLSSIMDTRENDPPVRIISNFVY